ncbi:uncharacterized protein PHACADRAFT_255036 [Phanerochaete carnosa HHB-10118-sp]|uniref:Uncharacterized protein n=1 Tax=Phanerochaete carnosa (strain HHB-10118-sp) TaxID=650164 RepID=K5X3H0_PHACS|nr:uncharacterized protein PHACADRAFT_255036 [Phanerochaete carnosa HHB-10118-sp]EKM57332.1 hypothetical protein PHACADRAFT_255036 [Phanerochaete carnosa HHB-10118-sp]
MALSLMSISESLNGVVPPPSTPARVKRETSSKHAIPTAQCDSDAQVPASTCDHVRHVYHRAEMLQAFYASQLE